MSNVVASLKVQFCQTSDACNVYTMLLREDSELISLGNLLNKMTDCSNQFEIEDIDLRDNTLSLELIAPKSASIYEIESLLIWLSAFGVDAIDGMFINTSVDIEPTIFQFFDGMIQTTPYDDAINSVDEFGDSPLHFAVESGSLNKVKNLLSNGAKVNLKNNAGISPLFSAVNDGEDEIVRALLKSGADPSTISLKGGSALWHALQLSDREDIAISLIDAGADLSYSSNLKDYGKVSLLDLAVLNLYTKVSSRLCQEGVSQLTKFRLNFNCDTLNPH